MTITTTTTAPLPRRADPMRAELSRRLEQAKREHAQARARLIEAENALNTYDRQRQR